MGGGDPRGGLCWEITHAWMCLRWEAIVMGCDANECTSRAVWMREPTVLLLFFFLAVSDEDRDCDAQ